MNGSGHISWPLLDRCNGFLSKNIFSFGGFDDGVADRSVQKSILAQLGGDVISAFCCSLHFSSLIQVFPFICHSSGCLFTHTPLDYLSKVDLCAMNGEQP